MKSLACLSALSLIVTSAPAWGACLPPPPLPPGATPLPPPPPPTLAERAESAFRTSTDIVYGVLVSDRGMRAKFRVLHVYKGTLKKGQVIRASWSFGFDPPPCAGMIGPPPPVLRGADGVIAFTRIPELRFVPDDMLEKMFEAGWIRRAATGRRSARRAAP